MLTQKHSKPWLYRKEGHRIFAFALLKDIAVCSKSDSRRQMRRMLASFEEALLDACWLEAGDEIHVSSDLVSRDKRREEAGVMPANIRLCMRLPSLEI